MLGFQDGHRFLCLGSYCKGMLGLHFQRSRLTFSKSRYFLVAPLPVADRRAKENVINYHENGQTEEGSSAREKHLRF